MRPSLLSPRGVADFVSVDENAANQLSLKSPKKSPKKSSLKNSIKKVFKKPATKEVEKSPLKSSLKKTPSRKSVSIQSDKEWDGKKAKKVKVKKSKSSALKGTPAPVLSKPQESTQELLRTAAAMAERASDDPADYKIQVLKAALEEAAERLKSVTEQQQKDKERIKEAAKEEKKRIKDSLEKLYKPVIDQGKQNGKSNSKKQEETAQLIQYLKDDNAKIRKSIESYARKIKEIKKSNANLERCNHQAAESYKQLEEQVADMTAVRGKLEDNCAVFKEALKKMKKDYKKRTAFHSAETNCSIHFDTCISKIVKNVTDRSRQADLIEEVGTMSAEGTALATTKRQEHSPNADLEALPVPQKGKNKGSWSFMHEDDDDESNESDSDDEDSDDEE